MRCDTGKHDDYLHHGDDDDLSGELDLYSR